MHSHIFWSGFRFVLVLIAGFSFLPSLDSHAQAPLYAVAFPTMSPASITWHPHVKYTALTLKIALPTGKVIREEFAPGQPVGLDTIDSQGNRFPDGQYTYELVVIPEIDPSLKQLLAQAQENHDYTVIPNLQDKGLLPYTPLTQTGYFTIANGAIVLPTEE
jgi:hypothetical protein